MPETVAQRTEKGVPDSPLGRLYREHIDLILKKDIEAILDQYAPDALLISSFTADRKPVYYKGREQLREHFKGILGLQGLKVEIAFWGETPDTLMIVEAIEMTSEQGTAKMRFADSWVLKGGKIAIHFAGMTQYPDGSVA